MKNYSLPETARFRQIHEGHCTFLVPEERRFITPEAIAGVCIVGTPEEIIHRVREMEKAGIKEITMLPPADYQRKVFRDMAEMVHAGISLGGVSLRRCRRTRVRRNAQSVP